MKKVSQNSVITCLKSVKSLEIYCDMNRRLLSLEQASVKHDLQNSALMSEMLGTLALLAASRIMLLAFGK